MEQKRIIKQLRGVVRRSVRENYHIGSITFSGKEIVAAVHRESTKNTMPIKMIIGKIIIDNDIKSLSIVFKKDTADVTYIANGGTFASIVDITNLSSREILSSLKSAENYTHDDLMRDLTTLVKELRAPEDLFIMVESLRQCNINSYSEMRDYVQQVEKIITELDSLLTIMEETERNRENVISLMGSEMGRETISTLIRSGKCDDLVKQLIEITLK